VPSSIVGRASDLAELHRALDDAVAGRGSLVLITGEPGIGKTRLAEELADVAASRGARVAWASCWEGDGAPAYWPWIQVVRSLVGESGELLAWTAPGPAEAADAASARFGLFDKVGRFLRRTAAREPLVLVVDDVHWADVPSVLLLRFLARELRGARALLLATYRDLEVDRASELGRAIDDLARDGARIALGGLAHDEVADLLAQVTGAAPDRALAGTVHARSRGNPLFVRELGRLFVAQGRAEGSVPEGVRPVLERRLARLSQSCFDAMAAASVIGQRFDAELLATVSATVGLPGLLDESERARVIEAEGPSRWTFTHALVRDVLYEGLAPSKRATLHRAVGNALEAADGERAAEIAVHFLQAGDRPRALGHAHRAGRLALEMLAFEDAAGHFERALNVADPDDDRYTTLLLDLGDARMRAGDIPAARAAFEQAAAVARRRGSADDLARAALGFGAGLGGFEVRLFDRAQLDLLAEALGVLPKQDSVLRAWVLARLAVAQSLSESEKDRQQLSAEAVAMARRIGDDGALAYALGSHCDALAAPEHIDERLALSAEMIDLAIRSGDRAMELLGRRHRLVASLEAGDLAAADAEIDAFAAGAEHIRQPLYQWYVPLWRAMRALMRGDLAVCEDLVSQAEAIGARAQSKNAWMLGRVFRFTYYLDRGEEAEAFEQMRPLMGDPGIGAGTTSMAMYAPRAMPEAARAVLDGHVATRFRNLPWDAEWLPAMCQAGEACLALGHDEGAAVVYEALQPFGHRLGVEGIGAGCYGAAARFLGLCAQLLGRTDVAVRHFDQALEINRGLAAPLLVAHTLRQYGTLLVECGERERGEAMLREARETYRSFGYTRFAGDVPAEPPHTNVFRREGELWTLSYAGRTIHLKDAKGLHDIASLVARPGREVHVADLIGSGVQGDAGPILDDRARREYRARLTELQEDLDEADRYGDVARSERAREEMDFLAGELAAALGLGGRARATGDPAERARKAVTQRIRNVINRVAKEHPELGRHLDRSVRTGRFCSYGPESPVDWTV
jgi:tetratricopeptide (TPR) repeat protein